MNDYVKYDKAIVRELSCRLCLCSDVIKLKPLSLELKKKLKKLFDISVKPDDNLPKAICHECLQQIGAIHRFTIGVEKIQNYLEFQNKKGSSGDSTDKNNKLFAPSLSAVTATLVEQNSATANAESTSTVEPKSILKDKANLSTKQKDGNASKQASKSQNNVRKQKSITDMKYQESLSLDEFLKSEGIDDLLDISGSSKSGSRSTSGKENQKNSDVIVEEKTDTLDPVVLINGKPAKRGAALERQISLFYNMECYICHQTGFQYRDLIQHYKDRHGVPGYVTCCEKKFHYFKLKDIVEHMAYHLQPNIFQCPSCHANFLNSKELRDHKAFGGKSEGKIICPRCQERFPTYRELGVHLKKHRSERPQCDYCGKWLRHQRHSKSVNSMENVVLCTGCIRLHKDLERQNKERRKESDSDSESEADSD